MERVPYGALLGLFREARFDRRRCHEILEENRSRLQIPDGTFVEGAILRGEVPLTERALFPEPTDWVLSFSMGSVLGGAPGRHANVQIGADQVGVAAEVLALATRSDDADAFREACSFFDEATLARLVKPAAFTYPRWKPSSRPGLHRREHASLLVQSARASVLLDPICLLRFMPFLSQSPCDLDVAGDRPFAVAVTHSHMDHFHLPSLTAYLGAPGTSIVVPRVPRRNHLSLAVFDQELSMAGYEATAAPWGSVVTVGDIEIDVLPFYGEQPTRDAPGPGSGLRSWGNCYRFNTPDFSAVVLVDTGADPAGDMVDALSECTRKRGPVDVVLSCMREFPSPFFGGLEDYWACLPFDRLRELFAQFEAGQLPSTTAGVRGLPDLCAAAGARYYLPYANGFEGAGREIGDIGWGAFGDPSERVAVQTLASLLRERGVPTTARLWNPGDSAHFGRDGLEIEPYVLA